MIDYNIANMHNDINIIITIILYTCLVPQIHTQLDIRIIILIPHACFRLSWSSTTASTSTSTVHVHGAITVSYSVRVLLF